MPQQRWRRAAGAHQHPRLGIPPRDSLLPPYDPSAPNENLAQGHAGPQQVVPPGRVHQPSA
eukprot:scaffold28004_cov45-Isochrysis_galbana.AAC.1